MHTDTEAKMEIWEVLGIAPTADKKGIRKERKNGAPGGEAGRTEMAVIGIDLGTTNSLACVCRYW